MNIIKRIWFKLFGPEQRTFPRYTIAKSSQCVVTSGNQEQCAPVYLSDISASGLGFYFKNSWFDVGEKVEVYLEKDSKALTTKGHIASQRIYYPENSNDLKNAIFRYSVHFEAPLATETVDFHRNDNLEN